MNDWKKLIDSQVSSQYIKPLYPNIDEDVDISIAITKNIEKVYLFITIEGDNNKYECKINQNVATATIKLIKKEASLYYFVLVSNRTYYYYSNLGVTSYIPSAKSYFELIPNLNPPKWVSSSICYQIFPDRFRNGDSSLDLKDGEYEFDGSLVKHMDFNEPPLPYDEGKCLDFYGGDFQGIIDSISYLKKLNINTIYINPIGISCTTHRYDCCDFFTIDPKLGGDEMFIKMISSLHMNGIKLIVDISINHTGINHPWFIKASTDSDCTEANYYYINKDGKVAFWENVPTLPQLNYSHTALKDIMYKSSNSVMKKFLKAPYYQDGWRLDVADVVGRRGKDQLTHEIWKEVRNSVKSENDEAYIVGECWHDSSSYLMGNEWDGSMNYIGCSRPIRKWMGETDVFLLPDWGQNPPNDIAYSGFEMRDALKCQIDNIRGQMRFFQMNLIDSHDTPRLHTNSKIMDFSLYKGVISLMYLLPGMPSTYYGDEIGIDGTVKSCEDWRYPMKWNEEEWDMEFYNLYFNLGKIRNHFASLLSFSSYAFFDSDESMMSFIRYNKKEAIILILNKGYARTVEVDKRYLNGDKIEIIYGKGDASFKENKIICHLEDKESLILHLN